ncbi:MAG TPA: DUF1598 domain-containing protein [Schlesneria sp.]
MSRALRQILILASLVMALGSLFLPATVCAQGNNGGNNNGGNNQNNAGGIKIDAAGVVSVVIATDSTGTLDKKRRELVAKKSLNADINQTSELRYLSLVEWEQQIDKHLTEKSPIPDEVFFLAGLQQITDIFVLPETRDLVIAGPAEGFAPDAVGRMIGVNSGRPTLRLDDFVVALRTLRHARNIGCSIDPVPERLAELQKFIKQGGAATADVVEARFKQMDDILGMQTVRVDGVSPDTHFAVALVEADYRMKRIAMGHENPGVKGLKSHLAMLGANGNTMQRWWFVPLYDAIYRSDDGLAFQFAGQRLQLLAEEEIADAQGNRSGAATTRISTKAFAKQFTEKFPELAAKSPIFGELQNLTDWSVFVALLQKERLADKVDWKMVTLLDEQRLGVPTFNAPKQVPSSVNYKKAGSMIVGLVGGGVSLHPSQTLNKSMVPATDGERLDSLRQTAKSIERRESHRWWWDAEKKVAASK